MIVEFTRSFDRNFEKLPIDLQIKTRRAVETFIDCYTARHFPKGLRVHKCGPFVSISISIRHRIFILPIPGGIKFVFVGDHADADRYLRRG